MRSISGNIRVPSPSLHRVMLALFSTLMLGACTLPHRHPRLPSLVLSDLADVLTEDAQEAAFKNRIQTKSIDGVTVSAGILPDAVARERYGVNLAKKGMQAVWLRIANTSPDETWLLTAHLDPDYYTADEAAYLFRNELGGVGSEARQQRFRDLTVRSRLEAGRTYEGHVLIPRTEGGRFIDVTLAGHGHVRRFGFPLRTPDGHFDFEKMDPAIIYASQKLPDLSLPQLRKRLEQLPATTTNAKQTGTGDPLNIVLIGSDSEMMTALSECGWSFSHGIDWITVRHELASAILKKPYLTAPLSALYLFERQQDISFQRSRPNLSQRNHMRLWRAPYTVKGQPVWIGQVSRDIGIKLTRKSSTFTTHVIDPMVDEARQFVLESLLFRYRVEKFGFVRASEPAPLGNPRANLSGDPYMTDGMRLIVMLATDPVRTEDVRNLNWEKTGKGPVEFGQSAQDQSAKP